MYTNTTQYLRSLASDLVHGCRRTAADGTVIYTPDGTASYDGLWLRDFSYMVEYAGFAIPDQDIVNCIRYAVRHRRADGWMPDRVTTDGLAVYAAGIAAAPVGEANLDNTPFLIFTVDSLSRRMDTDAFLPLFTEWEAVLEQGLFLLPIDENGLVYNDVQKPHSPYGFTDTIGKTGTLYMESLLYWRACRMMDTCAKPTVSEIRTTSQKLPRQSSAPFPCCLILLPALFMLQQKTAISTTSGAWRTCFTLAFPALRTKNRRFSLFWKKIMMPASTAVRFATS